MNALHKISLGLLLFAATAGGPVAAATNFIHGLKISGNDFPKKELMEPYFQTAKDLGMDHIKIIAAQDVVNPGDNQWRWSDGKIDYDYFAELAKKYHVSIIPNFISIDSPLEVQTNAERFAEFVYRFVERYKDSMNIRYTEFQNEPNAENDGSGSTIPLPGSWRGTAEELVKGNNAAYEKIKAQYPDIMVGSAGFIGGSRTFITLYAEPFYKRYFGARPKFDFFAVHHYPKNSGYVQGTQPGDLSSEFHTFETYRQLLIGYGYPDKPIFVTEGFEDRPYEENGVRSWNWASNGEAFASWVESYMQTLSNAIKNNVIGKLLSGIRTSGNMGLINSANSQKRSQYYLVQYLVNLLKAYPIYSQHIAGNMNSDDYWVEEFKNEKGDGTWVAFNPLLLETTDDPRMPAITRKTLRFPQQAIINVGVASNVKISKMNGNQVQTETLPVINGNITITLGESPVFVEGPAIHLRVNGDSSAVVTATNPVTVDYTIRGGQGQEFFLTLDAPAMNIPPSYRNAAGQWVSLPANLADITSFTTAPADGDYTLYTGPVPAGAYSLCLGYDTVSNGHLDTAAAVYDCATATVR